MAVGPLDSKITADAVAATARARGAIEEEELAAFGLVLELFNHAIVERRAALQAAPMNVLAARR